MCDMHVHSSLHFKRSCMSMYKQFNPRYVLGDLQSNLHRISQEYNREVLQKGYCTDSIQTRVIQFVRLTFVLRGINKLFMARNKTKAYRQAIKLQVRELHSEVAWQLKEMKKFDLGDIGNPLITKQDIVQYFIVREQYNHAKLELKVKQDILANLNHILESREPKKKPLAQAEAVANGVVKNMKEWEDFYKTVKSNH